MDKLTKILGDFTPQARGIIKKSITAAGDMGSGYVGTEHILLAFFEFPNSTGAYLLKKYDVRKSDIYEMAQTAPGLFPHRELSDKNFSQNTKKVIQGSVTLSKNLGVSKAGSEHVLMMLLRIENSSAANILRNLEISVPSLYSDCANLSSGTLKSYDAPSKKLKALEKYGRELTSEKFQKNSDRCFERDEQMDQISRILLRRMKNNPCLIGEAGVGKSAIVEGLAKKIYENTAPPALCSKRIFQLDLSMLLAGAKYRGDFEERLKECLNEATGDKNIILFVDEIHSIMGTGAAEGAIDAASILKPELARGSLQLIGATTYDEYRSCIEKDAALDRRFQKVFVAEPDEEQTKKILCGIKPAYESFHEIKILDSAIDEAIKLSKRYMTERFFPDKAIDLIDEACSLIRMDQVKSEDTGIYDVFNRYVLGQITREEYLSSISSHSKKEKPVLIPDHIRKLVSSSLGIPISRMTANEREELVCAADNIKHRIIGQDEAVDTVMNAIRRNRVNIGEDTGVIGAFVFMGRSGVGKTALANEISREIFGKDSLIRFDMSEFSASHTVSRLIGSPAGYVGYENPGELTEKVRKKPYSVLLFDEIEKAHRDIFNLLLQILDTGFLEDAKGKRVSFKNTLVILTTNLGVLKDGQQALGFGQTDEKDREKQSMKESLEKFFSPELLNRIDSCVYFPPLSNDALEKIAALQLEKLKNCCKEKEILITFSNRVIPHIVKSTCNKKSKSGARGVLRLINNNIRTLITDEVLKNGPGKFKLTVTEDDFKVINTSHALKENAV